VRLGLLHIKQCVSKHRKEVHNGANPLHSPSLKNKKGHLQLRPVGALPDISPHRKHQVKRNACVNGLNHCLRQQQLHCITTYWDVVKYFLKKTENNLAMAKKTSAAAGLGHLFKQKMLSRVRRKRLNIPPGLLAAGVKMV